MFRKNLVGIHITKPLFVEYRPIQVGFANLNLSKYLTCDFHYNTWMHTFPNSTLLFTDTASLACEVVAHNLYTGMEEIKDEFDFSEFPEDHLQSFGNRKLLGKFKDKCIGELMLNFIGLYPKLYTFDYEREAHIDIDENGIEV